MNNLDKKLFCGKSVLDKQWYFGNDHNSDFIIDRDTEIKIDKKTLGYLDSYSDKEFIFSFEEDNIIFGKIGYIRIYKDKNNRFRFDLKPFFI